jgi:hypothetical protein
MGRRTRTAVLAMGLVLGCGDSSEGAGANGAGGGGNAGHDPGGGGGQGVGGTAGAGGADAFVGVGHIALSKLPYLEAGEPMLFDGLKASFYGSPEDDTGCSGLPAPPGCHVRVCEREVSFEPAAPEYVDAGTLTVTGGAFPVEAVQRANGMYEEEFDQLLFEGGEQLLIEVEGSGEVPACSVSLVAQSGVTVSAPDFDDPALTISRDEPLRVTWSGGGERRGVRHLESDRHRGRHPAKYPARLRLRRGGGHRRAAGVAALRACSSRHPGPEPGVRRGRHVPSRPRWTRRRGLSTPRPR